MSSLFAETPRHVPGTANIGQRLPAAAAHDRALLCIRRGSGADRHGAGGLRTVALASGGISHFPGTERYAEP
jgi:hypothetical protein